MKKKQIGVKSTKSKSIEIKVKKSVIKHKPKDKYSKKQQQPSLFVLVGDNFYVASSKTERKHYQEFQQKVKVGNSNLKKSKKRGFSNFQDSINVQEYVKTLSKDQKSKLLHDLQKEFEQQKMEQSNRIEQKQDKMSRLTQKLQGIKNELITRWDLQITKINHSFENQQIGLQQKNQKIILIQKIKNNKIAMINYTKVLFDKILREEPDIELQKSERMQNIINSLNSISSMDLRDPLQQNYHHLQNVYPQQPEMSSNNLLGGLQHQQASQSSQQHQIEQQIKYQQLGLSQNIKIEDFDKSQPLILSKQSLKLDIRLDQVRFGKDEYEQQVANNQHEQNQHMIQDREHAMKLSFRKEDKPISKIIVPFVQQKEINQPFDDFFCTGEEQRQVKIPMLMTKDRLQQIEFQKSSKEIQALSISLKARQSYQLSEVVPENADHFTTLIDVNRLVVQFYEFIMKHHIRQVVEGMNVPYGKSCADKLYVLRQEGYVPDHDHNNVLLEEYLHNFHEEMALSGRIINEQQKIHNIALFHAFNAGLNVYRPFFELQGEVFLWNPSEKGLTFYQINEENIEQVFEKSKMKVLEHCTSLCGLMVDCEVSTLQGKKMLSKRNQDVFERILKSEMLQKFGQWNIKKANFQALSRINLCNQIFEGQIQRFCQWLLQGR